MQALMNIMVRVNSKKAQGDVAALQTQVQALEKELARAGRANMMGGNKQSALVKWGNQLQWTGRQLQYNWTLPLIAGGAAATKWAMDNEKAFTHVRKVYGDTAAATAYFNKHQAQIPRGMTASQAATRAFNDELGALRKSFVAMSNHYGVAQKDVLNVAGAWAAAGKSGLALAKSVNLTMQAMILGDMDATKATDALISIQAQYGESTKGLARDLAYMNAIENQTAISLPGLIEGFQRSAGVAREAGIDVRHLGALLAAMVPAAGSASQAGNALKTVISRLLSPTKEANQVMEAAGIQINKTAWQSANAKDRLFQLADAFKKMSDGQRNVAASVIASRWQINKFDVLLRALINHHSMYYQALAATASKSKAFAIQQRELNAVLNSSPRRLAIIWETMKNGAADAIQPLIPYILYLANLFKVLVTRFSGLNPELQKFFLLFGLGLALVGPLVRYIGSFATLLGTVEKAFKFVIPSIGLFSREVTVAAAASQLSAAETAHLSAEYARLGYTTAIVDGELIAHKRGILAVVGSWLMMPFRKLYAGFGLVIGWVRMFTGLLGINAAAGALWSRAWAVIAVGWSVLWRLMTGAYIGFSIQFMRWAGANTMGRAFLSSMATMFAWATSAALLGWQRIVAISVAGGGGLAGFFTAMYSQIVAIAVVGWNALVAANAAGVTALATVVRTIPLLFGAVSTALWNFAAVAAAPFMRLGAELPMILGTAQASVMAVMTKFGAALQAAWWLITQGIETVWAVMYVRLAAISASMQAGLLALSQNLGGKLVALWTVMMNLIERVVALARPTMLAIWSALQVAMLAISRTFWAQMIRLWIVGMTTLVSLPRQLGVALLRLAPMLVRGISLPWTLGITAVTTLLYLFRHQIEQIWNNIVAYFSNSSNSLVKSLIGAWNLLPKGVQSALAAVVRIVHDAAMQVYEWFSYLNPFAHHSPSLVENVQGGMAKVGSHLSTVKDTGKHFEAAHKSVEKYGSAAANAAPDVSARRTASSGGPATGAIQSFVAANNRAQQSANQAQIAKFDPKAAAQYAQLAKLLDALTPKLNALSAAVAKQQKVVNGAQATLDGWNKKLDAAQKKLDSLQSVADDWSNKLSAAQDALNNYANAPLKGMQAMNDKIHANDMAQKKLQYQMMQMEKVTGTLDSVKTKLAAINGEQEMLQGQKMDLVAAGAGSEITGVFDKQIAGLQDTKKQYSVNMKALQDMQDALDGLQQKADELDLEKSLKFDDLTYQIEKAANMTKELSFDQIMAGIAKSKDQIALYTDKWNQANAAVQAQQDVVDSLTKHRDAAQAVVDKEQNKLDGLKNKYDALNDTIQGIKQTMDDAASAAQNMQQALDAAASAKRHKKGAKGPEDTIGLQNFKAASKANFPDVGGAGKAMRTDWKSQAGDIDKFTKQMADSSAKMFGDLNPFAPFRKKWDDFKAWISKEWSVLSAGLGDFFSHAFSGVKMPDGISKAFDQIQKKTGGFEATVTRIWNRIKGFFSSMWALFGPDITKFGNELAKGFRDIWNSVGPELSQFVDLIKPIGQAIANIWNLAKPFIMLFIGGLLQLAKIVTSVVANTIGPVLSTIGAILGNVIQVIRGFVEVVVAVLSGDWSLAWKGVVDIVSGTFGAIWDVIKGAGQIIWGVVKGIVEGVWNFFAWLADELVGHSIIPDMVDAIITVFQLLIAVPKWIWDHVLKPTYDFFVSVWKDYIKPSISQWWDWIKSAWNGLLNAGQWVWDNVLKPVWNWFHDLWTAYVKPALDQWWSWIKTAWNALGQLGQWVWDNVLKPVFGFFTGLWTDHIKGELESWPDKIHGAWDKLLNLGSWIYDNALKPVKNSFVNIWTEIKTWFEKNGGIIVKPIASVINVVIGVINKMIDGLNAIADALPGIDWNIGHIPDIDMKKLAEGGEIPLRYATKGFVTNGPRAIVGEGKPNYPEYVIPTDPTYRNRAKSLLQQAGSKIGMFAAGGKLPKKPPKKSGGVLGALKGAAGAVGGVVKGAAGAVGGAAGKVADWVKGDLAKIVSTIFGPFKSMAQNQINKIDWDLGRSAANSVLNSVLGWVDTQDKVYEQKAKDAQAAASTAGGGSYQPYTPGGNSPWSRVSFRGFTMDAGQVQAILAAEKEYGGQFHITQGSYSTSVAASGSTHSGGGAFDMTSPVNDAALAALRHHGQAAWIRNPSQGPWPWHIHSLMIGDPNLSDSARGQVMDFLAGGDGLAKGGIVRARRGGTRKLLAEAGRDEAVIPLPLGWKNSSTSSAATNEETHLHFHGDLSFPNITSGEDAETLIANLKSLAGGAA